MVKSWRLALAIFVAALAVRVLTALPLDRPGYMDAYYYYDGAESLYRGKGFSENFIWNYLDDPAGLPHPSHLYWLPLSSILAWISFLVFGASYRAAQVPFIVLSACLPLPAYFLSLQLSGSRRQAVAAACFAIFSGFYLVFWVSPDNTAPFALLGSLSLICAAEGMNSLIAHRLSLSEGLRRRGLLLFGLAGALTGLGHLSRADGLLLLVALLSSLIAYRISRIAHPPTSNLHSPFPILHSLLLLGGYLAVMGPWFYRNWQVVGSPMGEAGLKTAFLRDYDDLFSYGQELSLWSYLGWGLGPILRSKLEAAWLNLQTLLFVDLLIFLSPFAAVGLWKVRLRLEYMPFFIYAVLLYLAMTFVFTFPGYRGGMLHSSGALLPHFFAASALGLDDAVAWIGRLRRGWHLPSARRVFTFGFVLLAVFLSVFIYYNRALGGNMADPAWNRRDEVYEEIAVWLEKNARPDEVVMVGNPPAFYYFTGRPCVVVPNEGVETLLEAAWRYGAEYLILDQNRPRPLAAFYAGDVQDERLTLLATFAGDTVKLYRIRATENRTQINADLQ